METIHNALPDFTLTHPETLAAQLDALLHNAKARIEQRLAEPDQPFSTLIPALEDIDHTISEFWSPISHLHHVADTPALRAAYNACLPLLADYHTWLGQNTALYQAYHQFSQQDDVLHDSVKSHLTQQALRDFKRTGMHLPSDKQQRYGQLQQKLSQLTTTFSQQVLDATDAWQHQVLDERILSTIPDNTRHTAYENAKAHGQEGWLLSLDEPCVLAILRHCDNADLRKLVYTAYQSRASDQGPQAEQYDNAPIMAQILAVRHQLATLLGYDSYAHYSLAEKMAKDPQPVFAFLEQLADTVRPVAEKELADLIQFAHQGKSTEPLAAWDIAYYSEQLRQQRYAISQKHIRPYFPLEAVLSGLFDLAEQLYGIQVSEQDNKGTWHQEVRRYHIEQNGQTIACFYLDPFTRSHKQGGAWMDDARARRRHSEGTLERPIAHLVCNFNPPNKGEPALLDHDDVITLFHEFGHGLHHMLSTVDYACASGITGVPWDGVELPSQMMENWCWHKATLQRISQHYQTGETLPDALLDKLLAAKQFQAGMKMMRQLEMACFDLRIHAHYTPDMSIRTVLKATRDRMSVIRVPEFNRFENSFCHIFAGGYAAGYYSYLWAEVLSADAFSKFEQEGLLSRKTGQAFLTHILQTGGSGDFMDFFTAFRGREPNTDALLRHHGIAHE